MHPIYYYTQPRFSVIAISIHKTLKIKSLRHEPNYEFKPLIPTQPHSLYTSEKLTKSKKIWKTL